MAGNKMGAIKIINISWFSFIFFFFFFFFMKWMLMQNFTPDKFESGKKSLKIFDGITLLKYFLWDANTQKPRSWKMECIALSKRKHMEIRHYPGLIVRLWSMCTMFKADFLNNSFQNLQRRYHQNILIHPSEIEMPHINSIPPRLLKKSQHLLQRKFRKCVHQKILKLFLKMNCLCNYECHFIIC